MRRHSPVIALLIALSGCSTTATIPSTGLFRASDGSLVELHLSPDQQIRGYLSEGPRVAALSSVRRSRSTVNASAIYDDGTRAEIEKRLELIAAEKPASSVIRREIEDAYRQLARAVETKNFEAFQALRVADFATIPPDGVPSPAARMADRARGLLDRIQPPIMTTNDILELTTRGAEAIATVRQKFTRQVIVDGQAHTLHTEVTQRETWRKTADGWKLTFVDEVRDPLRVQDGQRSPTQ
jgi:ketosteroid isomerase-like protein